VPVSRTTRIDIRAPIGTEELLPEQFYRTCRNVWIEDRPDSSIIKCYPDKPSEFLAYLRGSALPFMEIAIVEEEEKDYVELVRKQFVPIRVGGVTIVPPWRRTRTTGLTIKIEPGMAFGTGRHESTRLMLKMMKDVPMEGKRVLDLGSGSGILALYASFLGASRVVAVDIDPLAAEAAKKGCALNRRTNIKVVCAGIDHPRGTFDVVLANLDFATFSEYAAQVVAGTRNRGILVVSGIEEQHGLTAPSLFGREARLLKKHRMKDWYGFVFQIDRTVIRHNTITKENK
jgi:ribosomal protein L11 methyltransferase